MLKQLHDETSSGQLGRLGVPVDNLANGAPLVEVLWRRRWSVALTTIGCLLLAMLYLAVATPVYQAASRVAIDEYAPSLMRDMQGYRGDSESFLHTQATVFTSNAVLTRALASIDARSMNTFAKVDGDLVTHLQSGQALSVEAEKKSDVITISFDSAWPQEAALFVNSLVSAYINETTLQKQNTGGEMVAALQSERNRLQNQLDELTRAMLQFKRDNNVMSFREDKGNIALERATTFATTLTSAQINTIDLSSQKQAVEAALGDPQTMHAWVEAQQFKGRDFGDREFDDLRQQLSQAILAHASAITIQGDKNRNVQLIAARIEALKERLLEKEQSIARAHLVQLGADLAAAEGKETQLRKAFDQQQDRTLDLSGPAFAYAKMDAEAEHLRKQTGQLDTRMGELEMTSVNALPLNVRVLEPARIEDSPIKPKKALVLLAALMCGCLGGLGLAVMREWQDARLREPEEIPGFLGTPVVSVVPRINPRLSPVTRGQITHVDSRSPVAEAYRSIRTSLKLGQASDAKTILLASPAPGDGKSTTASNLAIAFAQSGERTLLIDCDLREPVQHMIFEMDSTIGVSSIMAGESTINQAVQPTKVHNLFLLPCGPVPQSPAELLAGGKFNQMMQSLCASFDRIIIDSPPLTCVTDARILAAAADATLLVLRLNLSIRKLGVEAMDMLDKVNANVIGAIANDAAASRGYAYYGGSWAYASHSKRSLPQRITTELAPVGNGAARHVTAQSGSNGNGARLAAQILEINEPDWAAEARR